jgi:ABC-type sugar transport system ATPase subunit
MSWLLAENVAKRYPNGTVALEGVSLAVDKGEFFTIVGPTNAGKSTFLKAIAGIVRVDRGSVRLAGIDVTDREPRERRVSLLFQNMALFPNLTGFENIAFPMRTAGHSHDAVKRRVEELAAMLKVGHVLDRLPRSFSGGEQQRVAIGRALAVPAQALLLDEPLTNLDARIRIALRVQFKALHRDTGQTILYVTHDQAEAFSLSDRIAVLNRGRVEQVGTPDQLYRRPVNRFVATFMGLPPMNLLKAELVEDAGVLKARGAAYEVSVTPAAATRLRPGARIALGVRPEAIRVSAIAAPPTPFAGEVRWLEKLGSKHILELAAGGEVVRAVVPPDHPVDKEGPVYFGFAPGSEHLLDMITDRFVYA